MDPSQQVGEEEKVKSKSSVYPPAGLTVWRFSTAGTHQTIYSKGKVHLLREASERDQVDGEGPSSLHRQEHSTGKLASTTNTWTLSRQVWCLHWVDGSEATVEGL